jgi:hypothetical protein
MLVGLLVGLSAVIGIPVKAARGMGYRGAYLGWAIVAFIGVVFFSMWVGAEPPKDAEESLVRAMKLMNATGPGAMTAALGLCVGCLLGAAFFRKPQ